MCVAVDGKVLRSPDGYECRGGEEGCCAARVGDMAPDFERASPSGRVFRSLNRSADIPVPAS